MCHTVHLTNTYTLHNEKLQMNVQTEPTVDPVAIGTQVHKMLVCSFVFDYSGCEGVQNKF